MTDPHEEEQAPAATRGNKVWRYAIVSILVLTIPGVGIWVALSWARASWDGARWQDRAWSEARSWAPDAELVSIAGAAVGPTGFADVTAHGRWSFEFRSPAREAAARSFVEPAQMPGAPPPALAGPTCRFEFVVHSGTRGRYMEDERQVHLQEGCGSSLPSPARCSLKQVWQRAIERGAPAAALATLGLSTQPTGRTWSFRIRNTTRGQTGNLFNTVFADDCEAAPAR